MFSGKKAVSTNIIKHGVLEVFEITNNQFYSTLAKIMRHSVFKIKLKNIRGRSKT